MKGNKMKPKERLYLMSKPEPISITKIMNCCMTAGMSALKLSETITVLSKKKFLISKGRMYTILMTDDGLISVCKKSLRDDYNESIAVAICARRMFYRIKNEK